MSQIKGIHHAQLTVPKGAEEQARAFYCGELGLPEVSKPPSLVGRGGFWLQLPGIQLHIGTEDGIDRTLTKAHLAFEVEDIDAVQKAMESMKLKVATGLEIAGLRRFETRDPFGNRLEFVQRLVATAEPSPDPKVRFSDRVGNYVKYRPSYPPAVLTFLQDRLGLAAGTVTADVGSGTGIFSALLLKAGGVVLGVEPNPAMRAAAEVMLGDEAAFRSLPGSAEATGLAAQSVGLVVAAQAFHWFDQRRAKAEFRRILQPHGHVALIWNDRKDDGSAFAEEYELLLRQFGTDYLQVAHRHTDLTGGIGKFFAPNGFALERFSNYQDFDFDGLRGRLLSSSYAPSEGHPRYGEMLAALRLLYDRHQRHDRIRVDYDTQLFWGHLA